MTPLSLVISLGQPNVLNKINRANTLRILGQEAQCWSFR